MIAIDRYAVRHPLLLTLARALNAAFFVATAIDCLLIYSPFTFEQFVKPQVGAGLTHVTVWHADLHWLVLSITTLTLAPLSRAIARADGRVRVSGRVKALADWYGFTPEP